MQRWEQDGHAVFLYMFPFAKHQRIVAELRSKTASPKGARNQCAPGGQELFGAKGCIAPGVDPWTGDRGPKAPGR